MNTKHEEVTKTTSELSEMRGLYLGERLLRSWKEDFVDVDTGDVVSIDRNELVMERGTFLGSDELTQINFLMQSGDIKEVVVSNQQRDCSFMKGLSTVWMITIELNRKKKNLYLYANCVDTAKDIVIDYVEQKYSGSFKILSLKEIDYYNLIPLSVDDENSEEAEFYKIESEILFEEEDSSSQNFILKATNTENAKIAIIAYLTNKMKDNNDHRNFDVSIIVAKKIPCQDVIEYNFSKFYLEQ